MKHIMKKQTTSCFFVFFLETFSLFDFVWLFKSSKHQKILDLNRMKVSIFDTLIDTKSYFVCFNPMQLTPQVQIKAPGKTTVQ